METKKRLSLDGPSSGGGPSALRRLTRSPTHRLSLRRSSSTSSSSSSASVASDESETPSSPSCVTRDTAQDECALYRFIVWAAVKRNACDKMTSEERRECPLLRCRKRFPNHELMLQHLYTCDQLAVGEYWCYSCEKVERFSDAKCKRCLGHPSRRRKIMSMAKNFFSSLGHKNKNSSLSDLDLDIDEAPPSYNDSLLTDTEQHQLGELFSTEIHEIDSSEIQLPTILEDIDEAETNLAQAPTPAVAPLPIEPLPFRPVELESAPILSEPFLGWPSLPDTVAPTNLMNQGGNTNQERPVLQLHTDVGQYRRKRSKFLAPSSSVRSNASTSSTNSTNSTSSTASYNISPMSDWSGAWTKVAGFESTLTSPSDDGGLFRTNSFLIPDKPSKDKGYDCENGSSDPFFPELQADIPMMDSIPSSNPLHNSLGFNQPDFSLPTSVSADLSLESNLALTDNPTMPPPMPEVPAAEPAVGYLVQPRSLVDTAWDTLEMHVVESMDKLQRMTKNHLVNQLRSMSTHSIAMNGLEVLTDILEGRRPASPVKLLCFIHLVYSFSLVIHEQDAPSRWTDLFAQAVSYSTWFSREDRQLYIPIVDTLWKPASMTREELVSLVRAKTSPLVSRSSNPKGKEPASVPVPQPNNDSLAFVAQYFLDQLEHSAIYSVDDPEIQTSALYMQHLGDITMDITAGSPYALAVNFMLKYGFHEYSADCPGFMASLDDILQRANFGTTTRRLELELMNAGKMYLPSDAYFNRFISSVRAQVDSLYAQNVPNMSPRTMYYYHGVKLIETLLNASQLQRDQPTTVADSTSRTPALDSLDEVIGAMTPDEIVNIDFVSGGFGAVPPIGFTDPMNIGTGHLSNPQLLPTPEESAMGGLSTAATSPPSPAPGSSSTKIESNSCCEICGYRPKGDPRWFGGSMAKHKKLQHATSPPKIYRCPFPGCTSQYKNRPDNLRQHQIEKGHFLEGQEGGRRPIKRKKVE